MVRRTRLSIKFLLKSAVLYVFRDESGYGMQLNRPPNALAIFIPVSILQLYREVEIDLVAHSLVFCLLNNTSSTSITCRRQ